MLGGEFEVSKNIMLIDMFVEMMKEYYICYYFYIVLTTIADSSIARTNVWNFNNWSRKCFFCFEFFFIRRDIICMLFFWVYNLDLFWIFWQYHFSLKSFWNNFLQTYWLAYKQASKFTAVIYHMLGDVFKLTNGRFLK